jgi:hypothetical protein
MNPLVALSAIIAGATFQLALDPLDIVCGVLIGMLSAKWWHAAVAAAVIGVAFTFIFLIANNAFEGYLSPEFLSLCRSIALLGWSLVGWLGRFAVRKVRRTQSSSGSA